MLSSRDRASLTCLASDSTSSSKILWARSPAYRLTMIWKIIINRVWASCSPLPPEFWFVIKFLLIHLSFLDTQLHHVQIATEFTLLFHCRRQSKHRQNWGFSWTQPTFLFVTFLIHSAYRNKHFVVFCPCNDNKKSCVD